MKCHFCSYLDNSSIEQISGRCHCTQHPTVVTTTYWESAPIIVRFLSLDNRFIVQLELTSGYTVVFANDEKTSKLIVKIKGFPLTPENMHKKLSTYITFS